MPHIPILITSSKFGEVSLTANRDINDPNMTILEAKQHFGSIRLTITQHERFNLWHAVYQITKPLQLKITVQKQYLGFIFSLKNNPHYTLDGLRPANIEEHQYDVFYSPKIDLEYEFKPETYILCGLNFKTPTFEEWVNLFEPLKPFFTSVDKNIPLRLEHTPIDATPRILVPLSHMLRCEFTGNKKKKLLGIKTAELTFFALQNTISTSQRTNLEPQELEVVIKVREHLLSNLTAPGTIHQIALKFGLNDFKLKTYFKDAFGTSIYAFLLEKRLQKAHALISETDKPLKQIATIVGYHDLSALSNAFNDKFGYRPSTLRKKPRKPTGD